MRTKIMLTFAAGLVGSAFAVSTCNQVAGKQVSGLAVHAPDTTTSPTMGQSFEIKWDPTSGYSTVSILLLKGPSTNVLPFNCIANSVPNSGSYTWSVPSSGLDAQSTGYGIQIIADGSGDFQYSTQFGIKGGDSSSSSSSSDSSSDTASAVTSTTVVSGQKVTKTIYHTSASSASTTTSTTTTTSCSSTSSYSALSTAYSFSSATIPARSSNRTSQAYATTYRSSGTVTASSISPANVTESVTPTGTMSVPASLANVGGSGHEVTSPVDVGTPAATSAATVAPASTSALRSAASGGLAAVSGMLAAAVAAAAAVLVL